MKLKPLDPIIEQSTSLDGVSVMITHWGHSARGLVKARVTVWNGRVLACDVIEPDLALDRRRLAKAAARADAAAVPDWTAIDATLVECAEALRGQLPADEVTSARANADDGRPSASFPGLVDLVADDDGKPTFLVLDPSGAFGVSMVSMVSVAAGDGVGETLVPPPIRALPWRLPRGAEVLRLLEPGLDTDALLFAEVMRCIQQHALLPCLPGHRDAYYELCAAWVFHTHYLESAAYSPIIAFFAVPERGKSRTGRTMTYLARRGIHTETLREANLFRDSQDRGAALFLDCRNLWRKAEQLGCDDILLQRFERGARVSRVLHPDRGPFADTVYFDIFGPTLAASNEPLGRILDTRCIPISMPLAPEHVEYPVPDEVALLPLRERLTAWRARQLLAGWKPAPMPKPAASRLGDVLLPLAQLVSYVAPERLPAFLALAKHLAAERRGERSLSWESAVATALAELESQVSNGLLLISELAERVNAERPEKEQLSNKRISDVLRSLGIEVRKTHANKAAAVWDDAKVAALAKHYARPDEAEPNEKTAETSAPVGSADANHANHANQEHLEAPYSVVSMVSVARGDGEETSSDISGGDANQAGQPTTDVDEWEEGTL